MSTRHDSTAEGGFTLVEVIIAAAFGIVMVLAIASTLDKGVLNSLGHQRQSSTLAIAQREVEKIRQNVARYGFDSLALTSQPTATGVALSSSPSNPDDLVTNSGSSGSYRIMENFHNTGGGAPTGVPTTEPLIVSASTGMVTPQSTGVTSGSVTAKVYRYVTKRTEACTTAGACDGDSRRVIIAVVPTNNPTSDLEAKKPFFFTAVFDNPVPQDEPGQTGSGLRIGLNIG